MNKLFDNGGLVWLILGGLLLWWLIGDGGLVEKLTFPDRPMMSTSYNPGYAAVHAGPIMSGTTRGMSYDIRGDPYLPYFRSGPWNQASRFPIRNRQMTIGS